MEGTIDRDKPEVRLRAFRAIDEPETCALFIEGHTHVLTNIGVTKVSYSKNGWVNNPAAFVIVVESLDGKRVFGGARVHVSGGSEYLPIETATGAMDKSIYNLVGEYAKQGTGELCGLWNSREIAGYGVGSIFLIRAGAVISYEIGLQSLFALCAPYTVKPVQSVGMELVENVGNQGTFYYPKLDLIATAMVLKDVRTLSKANEDERKAIITIRENLTMVRNEELRGKNIIIHYEAQIPNLDKWDLQATIINAEKNRQMVEAKIINKDWDFL